MIISRFGPVPLLAQPQVRVDLIRSQRALPRYKSGVRRGQGPLARQRLVCLHQYVGLREAVSVLLKEDCLSVI